ncbi:MAG: DUF1573 domain-containing protein [Bacteroidales bacterium]|nr:DUF1573 domain-containing protein [Bacteroidales bacterium]
MKNVFLFFIFLIPILGFGQWGTGTQQLDPNEFKGPKISWVKEIHDFGTIKKNFPVEIKFEFKNTGNSALLITNVDPSCGCTAADYTKTPVMPGQTGFVLATYDATDVGKFSKSITVTTNTNPAKTILKFQGTINQ